MNISRISYRHLLRITGLLLLIIGILGTDAASYDILITLTSNSLSSVDLYVTEPTGETCSEYNDYTLIGGWVSTAADYKRYHLENAMDGHYYVKVRTETVSADTECQVTVQIYEGTSSEIIYAFNNEMYAATWEVCCFKMPEGTVVSTDNDGCFIATASFGTPMSREVMVLSEFRDKILLKSKVGTAFVKAYYTLSPPVAKFIAKRPYAKLLVRHILKPYIAISSLVVRNK